MYSRWIRLLSILSAIPHTCTILQAALRYFYHARVKRKEQIASKRQKSRDHFHKAQHTKLKENYSGTSIAHLYWLHAWGVYKCLRPFLGRDLGQVHKGTNGKESYH